MLYVSWFLFAVNIKSIKSALDLHLMSSRCTVCMDSTNKTIVIGILLKLLSSSLLLAGGTGGNEVDCPLANVYEILLANPLLS